MLASSALDAAVKEQLVAWLMAPCDPDAAAARLRNVAMILGAVEGATSPAAHVDAVEGGGATPASVRDAAVASTVARSSSALASASLRRTPPPPPPWSCELCGHRNQPNDESCCVCTATRVRRSEEPVGAMTDVQLAEERAMWACPVCAVPNGEDPAVPSYLPPPPPTDDSPLASHCM